MENVVIIAEAGVNHNGSLEIAKQLIDIASKAGADYIKFQTYKTELLVNKQAEKAPYQQINEPLKKGESQFDMLKRLELSFDDHDLLITYCKQKDIKFLSTPFDEDSLSMLVSKGVDCIKIPSGEITNLPFLMRIAATKLPVILSTGMSDMHEINSAVSILVNEGMKLSDITLLHCTSSYPTPMQDVNLNAMVEMSDKFKVKVGYSDHTEGIEVAIAAVALGATVIEKHFTISRKLDGPDHKASLEENQLQLLVHSIRNIESALGSKTKAPTPTELINRKIVRKSIHLSKAKLAGQMIEEEDLIMKRPGTGISPMDISSVIGHKVVKNLPAEHLLKFEDFE